MIDFKGWEGVGSLECFKHKVCVNFVYLIGYYNILIVCGLMKILENFYLISMNLYYLIFQSFIFHFQGVYDNSIRLYYK